MAVRGRFQHWPVLVFLTSLICHVTAQYRLVSDSECDCFLTNDSTQAYFAEHHFFDFRSLSQYAGVPALIASTSGSTNALAPSDYFILPEWNEYWIAQKWNNSASVADGEATVLMVNSPNNVYIEKNDDANPGSDTYLTLRTARQSGFQSAAEFESVSSSYQFLSLRMLARTTGPPGAVSALFTLYETSDASQGVEEADLEIRTQDPQNRVQCTNQPGYTASGQLVPNATRNATMPDGLDWTEWVIYRLDWTPENSTWYVDGQLLASIALQTPQEPSQVFLNMWSDGGSWSGNMTLQDEAYLQIQWIDMVFNSTEPVARRGAALYQSSVEDSTTQGGCTVVCSIDATNVTGTPVLLWGNITLAAPDATATPDVGTTSDARQSIGVVSLARVAVPILLLALSS